MKKIVTFTINPTIDKNSFADKVIPDEKIRCEVPTLEPGGGGINVSRVIKRLSGNSTAYYTLGGSYGEELKKLLRQEKINSVPIKIKELTRENLIITDKSNKKQYRFGMPGPRFSDKEWKKCLDIITNINPTPEFIVASGSLPPGVPIDFYARLAKKSKKNKIKLILDASGKALRLAIQEGVYLIKPNMRELSQIAGKEIQNEFQEAKIAKKLIAQGKTKVVILSMGAGGGLLVTENLTQRMHTPSVPIKSRVGAGDSMVGGIVFYLAQNKSLLESAYFGMAAGTAAVMTPGTELCRKKDVEMLFNKLKKEFQNFSTSN